MRIAVKTATAVKKTKNLRVRTSGGIKVVASGRIRTSEGMSMFYQALADAGAGGGSAAITVSPTSVSGARTSSSSVTVTTRSATVSVSGGTAPYTYSWANTGGDPLTITNPTSATTTFSGNVAPGGSLSGTFVCTVTDATGASAPSPAVTASVLNLGGTL